MPSSSAIQCSPAGGRSTTGAAAFAGGTVAPLSRDQSKVAAPAAPPLWISIR